MIKDHIVRFIYSLGTIYILALELLWEFEIIYYCVGCCKINCELCSAIRPKIRIFWSTNMWIQPNYGPCHPFTWYIKINKPFFLKKMREKKEKIIDLVDASFSFFVLLLTFISRLTNSLILTSASKDPLKWTFIRPKYFI